MVKWGVFHMGNDFAFLAFGTAFDVFFNKLAYFVAFVLLFNNVPGIEDTWVACHRGIMGFI